MLGLGLSNYLVYGLYVLGLIAVPLSAAYRPEYALLVLIPLFPMQNVMDQIHEFPLGRDLFDMLIIAMAVGCFVRAMATGESFLKKTPLTVPVLLLGFMALFSTMMGISQLGGGLLEGEMLFLKSWKNFMLMLVTFLFVVSSVKDEKYIFVLVMLMVFTMLPMDWYFYKTFGWVKKWHYDAGVRLAGTFTYLGPNELAAFYAQYSFVVLGLLLFDANKYRRMFYLVVIGLNFYCIMYLYSRSAYMGVGVGLLLVCLTVRKRYLVPLIVVALLWKLMVPVSVQERIEMTRDEEAVMEGDAETALDGSSAGRLELWQFGIDLWKQNPVFGGGKGVYTIAAKEIDRYHRRRDPHNMYVKMLAEMGLVGLLVYLYLYYLSLRVSWRLYRAAKEGWMKGLGFGFMICVVVNMWMNIFHDAYSYLNLMGYYWILLGLIVKCNMLLEEEREVESPADTGMVWMTGR